MTAPEIRHRDHCTDPTLRCSEIPLDRLHTRWRCLGCGAEAVVTAGPADTAGHKIRRWVDTDGYAAACRCGWRTCRRTRELRDRDADAHAMGPTR